MLYEECVRRCRELLTTARCATTIEQLRLWLDELGQESDAPVADPPDDSLIPDSPMV
jgi:hypothetical protein